ncbi:unnamed protein product, partial [Rotaria socialis]
MNEIVEKLETRLSHRFDSTLNAPVIRPGRALRRLDTAVNGRLRWRTRPYTPNLRPYTGRILTFWYAPYYGRISPCRIR